MSLDYGKTRLEEGGKAGGPQLVLGEEFEAYRVVRLLGRGGMGEVYEVEHRDLGTCHALKLIHPDTLCRQARLEIAECCAGECNRWCDLPRGCVG